MRSPESAIGVPIPFPFADLDAAKSAILDMTRRLLDEACKRWPCFNTPPLDPMKLAEVLGIPVQEEPAPDQIDAVFVPVGSRPRIVLNRRVRSRHRRRFSLCHELAHSFWDDRTGARYHLRMRKPDAYRHSPAVQEMERLCNLAAAEMLMPSQWFSTFVEERGLRASTVLEASTACDVSLQAAALRVLEFTSGARAIGLFEFAAPPSGRDRTLQAYRAVRVFTGGGFPYLFPAGKSVPDESVIYKASLRRGEQQASEVFSLGKQTASVHVTARQVGERLAYSAPSGEQETSTAAHFMEPPVVVATMEVGGLGADVEMSSSQSRGPTGSS